MTPPPRRSVSLLIPALNEAESAHLVVARLAEIRTLNANYDFEVILVDDGSTDATAEVFAKELTAVGLAYQAIEFSRNFGSHAAISAAVDACTTDAAITLSADLQEPVSLVSDLLTQWEQGYDIVWAVRGVRVDAGKSESGAAKGFSKMLAENSEIPNYPAAGPSQVLMSRAVLDQLRLLREGNRNILGLIAWLGFPQTTIYFEQLSRAVGTSRWNNAKRAKLAVDSFVGHSRAPLRFAMLASVGFSVLCALFLIATVVAWVSGAGLVGWALAGLICLGCAVQLAAISILGAYVWRAGYDSRNRPLYVVARTLRGQQEQQ